MVQDAAHAVNKESDWLWRICQLCVRLNVVGWHVGIAAWRQAHGGPISSCVTTWCSDVGNSLAAKSRRELKKEKQAQPVLYKQ